MKPEDTVYLRDFYRAVEDKPLRPDSSAYISLYEIPDLGLEDPVTLLARSIEWADDNTSAQLLSGFRGAGKSTELLRLQKHLTDEGFVVPLFDVLSYLTPSVPIDVSDFLIVTVGALSDELAALGVLPSDAHSESYWDKLTGFLKRIRFEEVSAAVGPVDVKASLRDDPTFRQRLQDHTAGHLAALVEEVREYLAKTLAAIPDERLGKGVVLLTDSIENISGTLSNAEQVQQSVERLFTSHANNLQLPGIHVVYTVPPWLTIRAPGVSSRYSGGLQVLHPLRVRDRSSSRSPVQASLDALHEVVQARGDWRRLLGEREVLDTLSLESGGHLRDLLRLISEIIRRADQLPVDELTVQRAITQMRSDMLPIAQDDARWLKQIAETHEVSLADKQRLPRLVTFLDSHQVLCYRNGDEWYDVHPLIRQEIENIAASLEGRALQPAEDPDASAD